MKVLIFGIGDMYCRYKHYFVNMEVVGFIDNNPDKWGTYVDGKCVYAPQMIGTLSFDYIFLVSVHYKSMRKQLLELGVDETVIIDKENNQVCLKNKQIETYLGADNLLEQSDKKRKKALLFSHVLNLSGAPIVLVRLAKVLQKQGYSVVMYSEKNSKVNHQSLLDDLLKNGISVVLYSDIDEFEIEDIKDEFDICIVNTLLLYGVVEKLLKTGKKICWWLHEMDDAYLSLPGTITTYPKAENLYVLSVGELVKRAYEKNTGNKIFADLLYGVPDLEYIHKREKENKKITFGLIGYYCERKGHEVLFESIERNKDLWMDKSEFYFVGSFPEEHKYRYESIDNVFCTGELDQTEIPEIYEKIDVLICPSLNDPMPVVVTEAMQNKILCIVTNRVGQMKYITDGEDGLICEAGSVEELTEKINWVLDYQERISEMGQKAYEIYLENFLMTEFEKRVDCVFESIYGE